MRKNMLFIILTGLFILNTIARAQSVDTAIEELEKRGLLTRIIEKYRKDTGQYAYLKDVILAVYDIARKGTLTPDLSVKLDKIESEIVKLKGAKSGTSGQIDEEKIKDLVREKVSELMRISEDRNSEIKSALKSDSLRIAQLEKRIKELETKSAGISRSEQKTSRWGILGAFIFASMVALISAH